MFLDLSALLAYFKYYSLKRNFGEEVSRYVKNLVNDSVEYKGLLFFYFSFLSDLRNKGGDIL